MERLLQQHEIMMKGRLLLMGCDAVLDELQEEQMGQDRMDAARLLQQHNVIVRGGPQEGKKLLDALVVSPSQLGCSLDSCMSTIQCPWRFHRHAGNIFKSPTPPVNSEAFLEVGQDEEERAEIDVHVVLTAGQLCTGMLVALCCADRALLEWWVDTLCECRLGSKKGNSTTFIDISAPQPDMPAIAWHWGVHVHHGTQTYIF